jgi:hypothetical protein
MHQVPFDVLVFEKLTQNVGKHQIVPMKFSNEDKIFGSRDLLPIQNTITCS